MLDRRRALVQLAGAAGLTAVAGPLGVLPARAGAAPRGTYGPLRAQQPDLRLPSGFRYVKGGPAGALLAGGGTTPSAHDGMGCFRVGTRLHLVRNHEVTDREYFLPGPAALPSGAAVYDPSTIGGCTTVEFDPVRARFGRAWRTLAGTAENCAGGPTPWGTWLSCEETTVGRGEGFEKPHGYVFEVSPRATGPVDPRPLRALGRFVHEAAAVDPRSGIVYLSEDNGEPADGFYRFLPDVPGRLRAGGRLQMLAVTGEPGYDTATGQTVGAVLPCHWVDIDDPDPSGAEREPASVFFQGLAKGGALFLGGEGLSMDGRAAVFTASDGGDAALGQVWRYRPTSRHRGELVLLYESTRRRDLDGPDNCVVGPAGRPIIVCEDGDGEDRDGGTNGLRALTRDGRLFPFAENTVPLDLHGYDAEEFPTPGPVGVSELAGACFSPGGRWLFVNMQYPGTTYAITGPW